MKILTIIIAIIICTEFVTFIHIQADKKAKDLFVWGYITGLLVSFILEIMLNIK